MKRLKSGDNVIVICGKSKGHVGKLLKVIGGRVLVEGANIIKKHMKPVPQLDKPGGIVSKEAALDASNVALYNPVTKRADKVGFRFIEKDGNKSKVRFYKSNSEIVDV